MMVFLNHEAQFGVEFLVPLGAGLVGVSSALLFVSWGWALSLLAPKQLVPTVILCMAVAFLLKLMFFFAANTVLNLVVIGAAIIVSAFPLDGILGKRQPESNAGIKDGITFGATSSKALFSPLSLSVCGIVLCCMIWGFSWGNALQGVTLMATRIEVVLLIDLCKLFTAIILLLLLRVKPIDPAQNLVLSLGTGFLLASWMFMMLEGLVGLLAAAAFSGAGIVLFDLALWVRLGELGRQSSLVAVRTVSVVRAIMMGIILFGIGVAPVIGARGAELFTPIFSVAFFILIGVMTTRKVSFTQAGTPVSSSENGVSSTSDELHLASFRVDYGLSEREAEVFSWFVRGHSARFISDHLIISTHTVKTHIKRVYEKTNVHSKDALITLFNEHIKSVT
jgi:DNA-binding CsgD family transcriptional regulator